MRERIVFLLYALATWAVAFLSPAFADSVLVYSQGGIPPASELFTWCDAGQPCDVSAPLSCEVDPFAGVVGSPEGGNALRVRANVWGGWGVFLQGYELDLSDYEGGDLRFWVKAPSSGLGPFNVKVEFQCKPDPIDNPAGDTHTTYITAHGWDGTSSWQEIVIPVCDFFPMGMCDAQCLSTVVSPFMGTIEDLPYFNQFWIDYVRWYKPKAHAGASSVEVQGRQLLVDGEPFVVNGVAYAPAGIGDNWAGAWRDRPDRYLVDFPLIAAAGANTVRLYAPLLTTAMLDAAWDNGLYVVPTYNVDAVQLGCPTGKNFMKDRFVEMVQDWKDHPAILFWLVGNNVNANLEGADLCLDWYPQLDSMALAAHSVEGVSFHPVATANADSPGLADICQAGCSDDSSLPNLDIWGVHAFRGCAMNSTFSDYQAKSDCSRPLVVTEFGMDAYDGLLESENEALQADCLRTQMDDAVQALAVRGEGNVGIGQVVFEWLDEWWKAEDDGGCGTGWEVHDTCASSTNNGYPDPDVNQEWFGIASQDSLDPDARRLRTALTTLAESWWQLSSVLNLEVVDHDSVGGNTTLVFEPAAGADEHTAYYGPLSAVSSYGYSGSSIVDGSNSLTLPAGSLFWIIVGRTSEVEGSYGSDSACVERPASPQAGIPQTANRTFECIASG